MTIRRTEFEVSVKGADATADGFRTIATEEKRATDAAEALSVALDDVERASAGASRAASTTTDATEGLSAAERIAAQNAASLAVAMRGLDTSARSVASAISANQRVVDGWVEQLDPLTNSWSRVRQAQIQSTAATASQTAAQEKARESAKKLQAEIAAVAQPLNVAKVAAEGAGKAMSLIMRAAYLLPGFGFAGILLAIGNAASWMAEQFTGGTKATAIQDAALREYTRTVEAATKAVRELGQAQTAAGRSAIGGALGIDPRALSGQARIDAARLGQQRDALDAAQKRIDAEYGALAARERSINERIEGLSESAKKGVKLGMFGIAADIERDIDAIGATRLRLDEEVRQLQSRETDYARTLERLRGLAAPTAAPRAAGGRTGASREQPMGDMAFALPGRTVTAGEAVQRASSAWGEAGVIARAEEERRAREQAEALERMHGLGLMAAGHAMPEAAPQAPSLLAVLTADDEERARFEADMETASAGVQRMYAATQEAADGARQLGRSMGLGLSNAAAAALLTGGSFKKLANDVLKSIAVQAAGLAIFETAKGLGNLALAAFGIPNAAAAAALNFQSAAMYGAVATVAGIGAGATGGLRSGGSARSVSVGAAPSMGGTSQYGGGSGGATVVQVYISGEQVTRAVRVEQSRQRMTGGITGRAA